jgi:prepilin-type N-terminal cleavage/methylation domain-containing protein
MKKDAGFTLIEIIITLVLLGIMGALAGMLIARGAQGYIMSKATNELSQKAQLALDRMILEFEDISAMSAVQEADPSSICYTSTYYNMPTNSTNDVYRCIGRVGSQIKIINELVNGTTLPTPATGSVLVDNVNAFQLDFYSIDDAFTANGTWTLPANHSISDLASIKIDLTLNRTDLAGGTYTCSTVCNVRRNGRIGRDDEPLNWNQ